MKTHWLTHLANRFVPGMVLTALLAFAVLAGIWCTRPANPKTDPLVAGRLLAMWQFADTNGTFDAIFAGYGHARGWLTTQQVHQILNP